MNAEKLSQKGKSSPTKDPEKKKDKPTTPKSEARGLRKITQELNEVARNLMLPDK